MIKPFKPQKQNYGGAGLGKTWVVFAGFLRVFLAFDQKWQKLRGKETRQLVNYVSSK